MWLIDHLNSNLKKIEFWMFSIFKCSVFGSQLWPSAVIKLRANLTWANLCTSAMNFLVTNVTRNAALFRRVERSSTLSATFDVTFVRWCVFVESDVTIIFDQKFYDVIGAVDSRAFSFRPSTPNFCRDFVVRAFIPRFKVLKENTSEIKMRYADF